MEHAILDSSEVVNAIVDMKSFGQLLAETSEVQAQIDGCLFVVFKQSEKQKPDKQVAERCLISPFLQMWAFVAHHSDPTCSMQKSVFPKEHQAY